MQGHLSFYWHSGTWGNPGRAMEWCSDGWEQGRWESPVLLSSRTTPSTTPRGPPRPGEEALQAIAEEKGLWAWARFDLMQVSELCLFPHCEFVLEL